MVNTSLQLLISLSFLGKTFWYVLGCFVGINLLHARIGWTQTHQSQPILTTLRQTSGHDHPLQVLLDPGKTGILFTGDAGTHENRLGDGELCHRFNTCQVGMAIGKSHITHTPPLPSKPSHETGLYVRPECTVKMAPELPIWIYGSFTYAHDTIHSAFSSDTQDRLTRSSWFGVARTDWENAILLEDLTVTPYLSLQLAHLQNHGRWNPALDKANTPLLDRAASGTIGLTLTYALLQKSQLILTLEGSQSLYTHAENRAEGEEVQSEGISYPKDQGCRVGLGFLSTLGATTRMLLMVNASNNDVRPTYWISLNVLIAF